jgi:hypothetical protein
MLASRLRFLFASLGLISLAEVIRLVAYGLPVSGIFSLIWAMLAVLIIRRIGALVGDTHMRRIALSLPAIAIAVPLSMVWVSRWIFPMFAVVAAMLALPIVTLCLVGLRLDPTIRARLRRIPIPAAALVCLAGLVAAAPPAWETVTLLPVGEPRLELASSHAGCFELTTGSWRPRSQPGHAPLTPSRFVRLDTARGDSSSIGRSFGSAFERDKPLIKPGWIIGAAYWQPIDQDRLELTYTNGLHGSRAVLRRTAKGYRGRVVTWTDVTGFAPSPRASLVARPISCALVPPDSARMPGEVQRRMDRINSKQMP